MAFLDSNLHYNEALTDYALAFRQDEAGYLWNRLLPTRVVQKRSDVIRQIDKGQLLRHYDLRIGKGAKIQDVQFKIGANLNYNAIDYAVEAVMRASESSNADAILQYEQELTYHATVAMHTNLEVLTVKNTLRDSTIMSNNVTLTGGDQWHRYNSPTSDPIEDLSLRIQNIMDRTGHPPNLIVMHNRLWNIIQRHPNVLSRSPVHPSGGGIMPRSVFEEIIGVAPGTIVTTSLTYNLALEDQTADFRSFIGPDVILAYTSAASTRDYSLGQSFMFPGELGGDLTKAGMGGLPFAVVQFPDNNRDPRGANVLRIVGGVDQKVLNVDAGELIINAVDGTDTTIQGGGSWLNN